MRAWLLAFLICTPALASECPSNWATLHPAWIWCDDFETDKSAEYFENTAPFARSAGNGRNGSYSMRAPFTSGQENAGDLKLAFGDVPSGAGLTRPTGVDTTTKFREVYYRVFLKSQEGWLTGNTSSKLTRASVFTASDWSQAMIAHFWSGSTNNEYLINDPASCVTGSTVDCVGYNDFANLDFLGIGAGSTAIFASPAVGNWHCIESHVKLNDAGQANGLQEFWIDGNLESSVTGLDYVGSYADFGINVIFFENFMNNGAPQSQVRDWDNIVVSTERIGCSPEGVIRLDLRISAANDPQWDGRLIAGWP